MSDKFFIIDDLLPAEKHVELFLHMTTREWNNQWSSASTRTDDQFKDSWHWNYTFHESGINMPAITNEQYDAMLKKDPPIGYLWDAASSVIQQYVGKYDILRLYANCNPYGTNAYIHVDDGDYTMLYYPGIFWNPEWEGGTCFYEIDNKGQYDAIRYVSYKPNRLVLFPAKIPHRGMPVDRSCTAPRYTIAMKLQRDVNDPEYAKEYYNAK